jgi:predicted RNase H-like HicB family nuclease
MNPYFTALIQKEDDYYVSLCPELDIASQGSSVEEAKLNLQEAVELFLETASMSEIANRSKNEVYVTSFEVQIA